jgi:hypothetical protein
MALLIRDVQWCAARKAHLCCSIHIQCCPKRQMGLAATAARRGLSGAFLYPTTAAVGHARAFRSSLKRGGARHRQRRLRRRERGACPFHCCVERRRESYGLLLRMSVHRDALGFHWGRGTLRPLLTWRHNHSFLWQTRMVTPKLTVHLNRQGGGQTERALAGGGRKSGAFDCAGQGPTGLLQPALRSTSRRSDASRHATVHTLVSQPSI